MELTSLQNLDQQVTVIAADADDVWRALGEVLDRSFSGRGATAFARLVGAADRTVSGPRPLAESSTFPGFRVAAVVPGQELVLMGRHRFCAYALIFRLEAGPGRARLQAETRANFPGLTGALYRRLFFDTGGHAVVMRRLLSAIRRRSERRTDSR